MYASLFFTKGLVCGENNIIGQGFSYFRVVGPGKTQATTEDAFFSPGRKISGIPFMSGKTAIYDDHIWQTGMILIWTWRSMAVSLVLYLKKGQARQGRCCGDR